MDRHHIEKQARRLQYEIYLASDFLFPTGRPPWQAMFQPQIAAKVLDIAYEHRDQIASGQNGYEAAGMLDRQRGIISISSRFNHKVQRFTGAHEVGHFLLHPNLDSGIIHRDRPIFEMHGGGRPRIEQEADYFAACFIAPWKLVVTEFEKRFGHSPLRLDETVAFHLRGESASDLFIDPSGSLKFAAAVAGAKKFGGHPFQSLADHFGISISAMAIRLQELNLVKD